jgi:hypothetical protein
MSIHRHLFAKLTMSTVFVAVGLVAAQAQDANAVATRFKDLLKKQGIEMSWASVSGDGASFALEGVKVAPSGATEPAEVGKVTFTGVTEANGEYDIESVATDAFSKSKDGITVDLSPVVFSKVKLPAPESTDPIANLLFYQKAEIASFSVKNGDKTAFSMEGLNAEITPPEEGKPMEFKGAAEKFTADLTMIEDPQSKAVIDGLGYQTVSGYLEMAGSWQPTDGRMSFSQYDITVDNGGTFGMTFDLGGYTPDFIKSMQDMQKKMAEQPAGADNSAQGLAMLGLMQQLTFHSASLRWDDDSLANKVLDYVAKMQNMKPDDIKNQAKAIVPFLTAQLNNPELSQQITAAVNKFLDDPKSLEISAEPATPVPFAQIAAAGMSNPIELTKTLAVSVDANEDE